MSTGWTVFLVILTIVLAITTVVFSVLYFQTKREIMPLEPPLEQIISKDSRGFRILYPEPTCFERIDIQGE